MLISWGKYILSSPRVRSFGVQDPGSRKESGDNCDSNRGDVNNGGAAGQGEINSDTRNKAAQ